MCSSVEREIPGISAAIGNFAKKYSFGVVEISDLEQEGWLSVVELRNRYMDIDPKERRSYVIPFVKRAMLDYSLSNRRIVKMISSKDERRAICGLCRDKSVLQTSPQKIKVEFAKSIQVSKESLDIAFAYLMSDISISADASEEKFVDTTLESFGIFSNLENSQSNDSAMMSFIYSEVDKLNEPEKFIINERWLSDKKTTLQGISEALSLSVSGVAFVEKKAIEKIKTASLDYI